ncbi:MAG TPA: sulfatase-like hydrolase/transferase, partial [Bacteroidales bacterium]|nr:sulfatase-like hydrolase/transferase [Bacteroidales bacterium]
AIPVKPLKEGHDSETLYLNSLHYTDACIGDFIDQARKKSWWKNTLVVITADHGSMMPGNSGVEDLQKYHIPMLMLGGALSTTDTVIHTVTGQTNIAATILAQYGLSTSGFPFSTNILTRQPVPGAFFTYSGGAGYYDGQTLCIYNTMASKFNDNSPGEQLHRQRIAKAMLQHLYDDFSRR